MKFLEWDIRIHKKRFSEDMKSTVVKEKLITTNTSSYTCIYIPSLIIQFLTEHVEVVESNHVEKGVMTSWRHSTGVHLVTTIIHQALLLLLYVEWFQS